MKSVKYFVMLKRFLTFIVVLEQNNYIYIINKIKKFVKIVA